MQHKARVAAETALPFETFRLRVDQVLRDWPSAQVLTAHWLGRTLRVAGPGCAAEGTYQSGCFRGAVQVVGPAVLIRGWILDNVSRMLQAAGCHRVRIE